MLGKGLESLIPQKGNGNGGDDPLARPPLGEEFRPEPTDAALPPADAALGPAAPAVQPAPAEPTEPFRDGRGETESIFHIEIEKITANPGQPRRNFDEAALRDLAHSIREFGFLQPLVVSRVEKETEGGVGVLYQLIAGERRLMAAKMLGLETVPAIVRNVSLEREKLELAVIENIQRENLNVMEAARAFQRLQEEFRMTQREVAAKLGKSREVVANTVRLLDLPEYAQRAVEEGKLSESNARLLLMVPDPGAQERLFEDITQNNLTTRDVKERVRAFGASAGTGGMGATTGIRRGRPPKSAQAPLAPELQAMQDSLSTQLGAPVSIQKNAANGRIMITFYSEEELENILRRLGKED